MQDSKLGYSALASSDSFQLPSWGKLLQRDRQLWRTQLSFFGRLLLDLSVSSSKSHIARPGRVVSSRQELRSPCLNMTIRSSGKVGMCRSRLGTYICTVDDTILVMITPPSLVHTLIPLRSPRDASKATRSSTFSHLSSNSTDHLCHHLQRRLILLQHLHRRHPRHNNNIQHIIVNRHQNLKLRRTSPLKSGARVILRQL